MLKHFLLVIVLSVLAVLFANQISYCLQLLNNLQHYISHSLAYVFSGGYLGRLIREVVVLAGIPIVLALVINAFYWLIKRQTMPIFTACMWLIWLLLIATMR